MRRVYFLCQFQGLLLEMLIESIRKHCYRTLQMILSRQYMSHTFNEYCSRRKAKVLCLSLFPQSPKMEWGSYFKTPFIRKTFLEESWSYLPPAFKHLTPPHSPTYLLRGAWIFMSLLSYLDLWYFFSFSHDFCWILATLKYHRTTHWEDKDEFILTMVRVISALRVS